MTISSMTGFARREGHMDGWNWVWEARSVNGKGQDVRLRLPPGMDAVDQAVRKQTRDMFARGNISLNLQLETSGDVRETSINQAWLQELHAAAAAVQAAAGQDARVDAAALFAVRGVVEVTDTEQDPDRLAARDTAILQSLTGTLADLAAARAEEGARLARILGEQIDQIEALVADAEQADAARPEKRRERLQTLLAELLDADPPVPEERLAQELALQATRGDIREEIDRLKAHVEQARELLASSDPVGRRLDFLSQEFNREANTLCSKSGDVQLTRVGMDLKTVIDRLREQVQNVE